MIFLNDFEEPANVKSINYISSQIVPNLTSCSDIDGDLAYPEYQNETIQFSYSLDYFVT